MKNRNQKGFSVVELLIIVVVIGLIGGVGWYVYQNRNNEYKDPAKVSNQNQNNTTTETSNKTDPYTGWKTYCDTKNNTCFKYPSDWQTPEPLSDQGITAFAQNPAETINVEYVGPIDGQAGSEPYITSSIDSTAVSSSKQVVGGYFNISNLPGYNLVNSDLVNERGLKVGEFTTIPFEAGLFFTEAGERYTLHAHMNNTTGNATLTTDQAKNWFSTEDGKTALLIVQSYFKQ